MFHHGSESISFDERQKLTLDSVPKSVVNVVNPKQNVNCKHGPLVDEFAVFKPSGRKVLAVV